MSSPAKTLYVLVPHDWTVKPVAEGAVTEIEDVPALGRKLARLTGAAYFHSSENNSVRFKVEPDSDGREHELELIPLIPAGFELADDGWELIASPAQPLIHEAEKQPRPPEAGELFVRRSGGKWAPLSGPLSGAGLMELSWRDPVANIQIEKRKLALVPGNARIIGTMKDALSGEVRLQGLPGWTATVRETACAVDTADVSVLSIRFTGRPVYRLPDDASAASGTTLRCDCSACRPRCRLRTGGRHNPRTRPTGRRRRVARRGRDGTPQDCHSSHREGLQVGWSSGRSLTANFRLELLRSAIDETLATLPGQDDLVELDFIGDSRLPIRISRYRYQQLAREAPWYAGSAPGSFRRRAGCTNDFGSTA